MPPRSGYPADHQATRRCRRIGNAPRRRRRRPRASHRRQWPGSWRHRGRRGVHRGPRRFLRHDHRRRRGRPRVRQPLLPERPRGHADALDLAPVHRDQPCRLRPRLRRGQGDGSTGHRCPRHRDLGDPHGVVRRAEGSEVLRDRLPPSRREGVGPLRRRQRHRHLPRVGRGHRARAPSSDCRRVGSRQASSPSGPKPTGRSRATRASTRSRSATATSSSTPTSPRSAPRPSRWPPATWPMPGFGLAIPTSIACAMCSTTSAAR